MVLKILGTKVIVVGKQKTRLKKALEQKAEFVIDPDREDVLKKIMTLTRNKGADVVFECTGNPEIWEYSVWLVRKGGTVILFGGCKQGTKVTYDTARIHYDEITLKGVFHYKPSDVARAFDMLTKRKIKVDRLISGEYPLHNLKTAFDKLIAGQGIKYAIIP